jgi:hypothetical protein
VAPAYLGAAVVDKPVPAGHSLCILDILFTAKTSSGRELERRGIDVHERDVRDSKARLACAVGSAPWCTCVRSTETLDPVSQSVSVDLNPCLGV